MEGEGDDPVYVMDETEKRKATPAGMLSRSAVNVDAKAADAADEDANMTRTYILAAALFVAVVVLGIVGVMMSGSELAQIDANAEAQRAAKPPVPDDIQGVRVRKGMKHQAGASPKVPPTVLQPETEPEPELNVIPDGTPPPDVDPAAEPDADATEAPGGDAN